MNIVRECYSGYIFFSLVVNKNYPILYMVVFLHYFFYPLAYYY